MEKWVVCSDLEERNLTTVGNYNELLIYWKLGFYSHSHILSEFFLKDLNLVSKLFNMFNLVKHYLGIIWFEMFK
jgi:hypothetical protein